MDEELQFPMLACKHEFPWSEGQRNWNVSHHLWVSFLSHSFASIGDSSWSGVNLKSKSSGRVLWVKKMKHRRTNPSFSWRFQHENFWNMLENDFLRCILPFLHYKFGKRLRETPANFWQSASFLHFCPDQNLELIKKTDKTFSLENWIIYRNETRIAYRVSLPELEING